MRTSRLLGVVISLILPSTAYAADPPSSAPANPAAAVASDDVKVGVTSADWVKEKFGKPNVMQTGPNGTKIWVYIAGKSRIKGSSFIPIIGLFAGGAKAASTVRVFTFNGDGILQDYSTTDSQIDCSTSIGGASCK